MQGIGWALNEEYIYNAKGQLENPGFLDYRMPVASDLPMIETILVEVPNPAHPYGVRGVGEVPIVPPIAAVGNAIARATGVRMVDLPMSPPRLSAALDAAAAPRRMAAGRGHLRESDEPAAAWPPDALAYTCRRSMPGRGVVGGEAVAVRWGSRRSR